MEYNSEQLAEMHHPTLFWLGLIPNAKPRAGAIPPPPTRPTPRMDKSAVAESNTAAANANTKDADVCTTTADAKANDDTTTANANYADNVSTGFADYSEGWLNSLD